MEKTNNNDNLTEENDDLEKLFEEFLLSIKALPKKDVDKIYENIKKDN